MKAVLAVAALFASLFAFFVLLMLTLATLAVTRRAPPPLGRVTATARPQGTEVRS